MKRSILAVLLLVLAGSNAALAQAIHFSQYYASPMLLSPANTALMPDFDYRAGANYRNQWSALPVPYNTFSAFADFKMTTANKLLVDNWLGLGLAYFSDKAGDGNLALSKGEAFAAYHIKMGEKSMLSVGLSGGYVTRSVNYDNLTFDLQWDGFTFNKTYANHEFSGIRKTNYYTVGAGMNFAVIPNENAYMKFGGSIANLNEPTESFYNQTNSLGMRSTVNFDGLFQMNSAWILNPSIYYTNQKGAYELVYGTLLRIYITGHEQTSTQLIFGGYNRLGESVIGAVGFQMGPVQFIASYDATISSIAPYTGGSGAMEFSLIYQGLYHGFSNGRSSSSYNCPRFF